MKFLSSFVFLLLMPLGRDKREWDLTFYLMPGMETTGCRLASSQVKAIPSVVGWLALSPLSATSRTLPWPSSWWMGLLLVEPSDDDGRRRLAVMSLDHCCNVQSQSMLTADELVNSTIRIPVQPPVTLSALSHPAMLLDHPLVVNTTSNAVNCHNSHRQTDRKIKLNKYHPRHAAHKPLQQQNQ